MRATAVVTVALLAGCNATMPQQQARRMTEADDPSAPCFRAIPSNAELAVLGRKIPLSSPNQATIEQLASKETPTEEERAALSKWAKMRTDCSELGRSFRAQYAPPGWANTFDQLQASVMQAIAALYGGGTYGEFNGQRQRTAATARNGFESASQNDMQARQNQQQAQQNQAVQNLQMLQLMQAMQPRPMPAPMPINPTVICNTRPSLGGTQTVCN